MCLALLEQMELVTSERVFVYFLLLQPLQQGTCTCVIMYILLYNHHNRLMLDFLYNLTV